MPAFDPVRDAVLNSPVTQTKSLPFRLELPANNFPHPSPTSSSSDLSAPSPLTRRATHLSVLLNDEPPQVETPSQSLFTPTTPRAPNALSHLLHPDEPPTPSINEQLAHATPLRRRSSVVEREGIPREAGSYFPSPLAFPSNAQERRLPPISPRSTPLTQTPSSPSIALPGLTRSPVFRSSTGPLAVAEVSEQLTQVAPLRRRSSGTSEGSREREGSFTFFTPPTRSPLAFPGHTPPDELHTRSPVTLFSSMPLPAGQPPSPTDSILSRPSTSGSTSGPRPISPMTKRSSAKSFSSVDMPPPPVPAPALNSPKSLPPKVHAPTQSPKLPSARLLKSEPAPAPSLFPRSGVPYAPRRITPANSVLIPLSPAELEGYRNYAGGVGTQILKRNKRKRDDNEQQDDDDRPSKRTRDVGLIAEHYNARPEVGIVQRKESPIIGLKNFNNWVKSVLISSFAHPVLAASPNAGPMANTPARQGMRGPARGAGKVLDLGCGKGGDVIKWVKARIREYVGVDIAAVSIDQARRRHSDLRPPKFSAYFTAADCYIQSLSDVLPPGVLPPLAPEFDVVSMQFCMHYAFESEEKARTMLGNVSNWLRPGGRLVGTVPNGSWLLERLDAVPKGAQELTFGNNVYQIRFEERDHRPIYGNRYWFYLKDAVDDVPEYVVHWSNFVSLAAEYGLHPIFVKEFHDVFSENEDHAEYGPLLQHMRVVDTNGESQMDEDQWEAANIYVAFAFEKR